MQIVMTLGSMVFRCAANVAGALPERARGAVANGCASLFYVFAPARRANVRENLALAGVPPTNGRVFGIFGHHTRNIVEMFASSRWDADDIRRRFEVDGEAALDDALAGGRGAVLVTAHVGNWELAALYLTAVGHRLHVVAGVQMNKLLTGALRDAKERRGIEVINPETPYRRLVRALESNGVVALLVDGDVYTGGAETLLFGKRIKVPNGPVRLSGATGAPIIAGYCRRLAGGRFRIHLEKVLDAGAAASLPEKQALAAVYSAIGRFITENVDQWCIFRRFWRNES
jgi:KDO2-lipid IV(A) lauroyltransferase